jgi:hypothetical protein
LVGWGELVSERIRQKFSAVNGARQLFSGKFMNADEADQVRRAVQKANSNTIGGVVVWAVIILAATAIGAALLLAHYTTP